jgi:hypothetical protein
MPTHDALLWVQQVVVQRLLLPDDRLLLVGLGVGKAGCLAGLAAKDAAQVGALWCVEVRSRGVSTTRRRQREYEPHAALLAVQHAQGECAWAYASSHGWIG